MNSMLSVLTPFVMKMKQMSTLILPLLLSFLGFLFGGGIIMKDLLGVG